MADSCRRVLVIGDHQGLGVVSFDWTDTLPNVVDYDLLVIDSARLDSLLESCAGDASADSWDRFRALTGNVSLVRRKLRECLPFSRSVYVLHVHPRTRRVKAGDQSEDIKVASDAWCPLNLRSRSDTGRRIEVQDGAFQQYFRPFTSWDHVLDAAEVDTGFFQEIWEKDYQMSLTCDEIATNHVGSPIALRVRLGFIPRRLPETMGRSTLATGGSVTFLPIASSEARGESVAEILRIEGFTQLTPSPDWAKSIKLPGEQELETQICGAERDLEEAQEKVDKLRGKALGLRKYKGLLYEQGLTLQALVGDALSLLGATVSRPPGAGDLVVEALGNRSLVEVKGLGKGAKKEDIAQLITDWGGHLRQVDEAQTGALLIVNGRRLLPPEKRGKGRNLVFYDEVPRIANGHGIGLLSTVALFDICCEVIRAGGAELWPRRDEVLAKILTHTGIVSLD